jgi:murein DD-endopeptidase MepM/ murein hydrolase activator NlpD
MAPKDTGRAMGTGGGGGIFGRKTELVADLTSAFKELNKELEKTKQLSDDISKNLKNARPGGGSNLLGSSLGTSTGTRSPAENDGGQGVTGGGSGGGFMGYVKGAGKFALQAGLIGLQGLPSVQQAFEQDLLRARFGFYGGGDANATQMRMGRQGTTTDPLDAARASMTGASMGLLPGLSNFRTIEQSAAGISNLMPGVGLQGGMQATAALNQARPVNMLRMIGVNVRDASGMMRGFDDIAKDIYNLLNQGKSGSGKITKEDISFSLQPGMSLDSMLNQYFGQDPILRQTVISKLMDMAGAGGATTSSSRADKQRLVQAGATTEAVLSSSDRNAASLNAIQAVAPSVLTGFVKANELLEAASNKVADIARDAGLMGDAFRAILTSKGFMDTLGSSANGATAGVMSLAASGIGGFLGSRLGAVKNLFSSSGRAAALTGAKTAAKGAARFIPGVGMVLSAGSGFFDGADGDGKINSGGLAASMAAGAAVGGIAGTPFFGAGALPGAAIGATIGGLTYGAGHLAGLVFGQGGSDTDTATPTLGNVMPFSGKYGVTSPYGVVRHLKFANGQKSPSYGKPHGGIDYGLPSGTPLFAVTDGTTESTSFDADGFGTYAKIRTDSGEELFYGHMDRKLHSGGARVKAGDLIGYSGNTGNSTGPHLHFEVRKNGNKIDPSMYLSGAGSASLTDNAIPPSAAGSGLRLSSNLTGLIFDSGAGGPGATAPPEFGMKDSSQAQNQTINYGGVTIHLNVADKNADVKAIANEVKRVLSYDNIREKAVNR